MIDWVHIGQEDPVAMHRLPKDGEEVLVQYTGPYPGESHGGGPGKCYDVARFKRGRTKAELAELTRLWEAGEGEAPRISYPDQDGNNERPYGWNGIPGGGNGDGQIVTDWASLQDPTSVAHYGVLHLRYNNDRMVYVVDRTPAGYTARLWARETFERVVVVLAGWLRLDPASALLGAVDRIGLDQWRTWARRPSGS